MAKCADLDFFLYDLFKYILFALCVLLIAPEREPVLAKSGAEWMPSFIELLQRKLTRITDPAKQAMVATGLVGALTALFSAYLYGRLATTREQFIDYCVDMLVSRASTP